MIEKVKLWSHQLVGVERAKDLANFAFYMEMGSGKTATAINTIRAKYNTEKSFKRTLIFCPPIVIKNWKREWLMHSSVDSKDIICLEGSAKKRVESFKKSAFSVDDLRAAKIFITNYEALSMEELYTSLTTWQPEIVVFDESHRLKNHSSKRAKLADKLVNGRIKDGLRPNVLLLSGSPVLNSPMDLFQQFKIMDGGTTFGANFFHFRAAYFRDKNAGMPKAVHFPNWVPNSGALEAIADKISPMSMRVLKKDCMTLPPLVRQIIKVDMDPEQRRIYNSMLKDYVAYFGDENNVKATSASLAITKGLRLMQICSGFVKQDETGIEYDVNPSGFNAKQQALHDMLEEILPTKAKVIVWATWRKNYDQIRDVFRKLGVKHVELTGDTMPGDRQDVIDVFNEPNSGIDFLLGNQSSGGVGANLTGASYAFFYSRNFSLEADLQAEARNYRGGSEIHSKITRYDLVTNDSIEEQIVERLAGKEAIGEILLKEIIYSACK